jgi:hypothetical protein
LLRLVLLLPGSVVVMQQPRGHLLDLAPAQHEAGSGFTARKGREQRRAGHAGAEGERGPER